MIDPQQFVELGMQRQGVAPVRQRAIAFQSDLFGIEVRTEILADFARELVQLAPVRSREIRQGRLPKHFGRGVPIEIMPRRSCWNFLDLLSFNISRGSACPWRPL